MFVTVLVHRVRWDLKFIVLRFLCMIVSIAPHKRILKVWSIGKCVSGSLPKVKIIHDLRTKDSSRSGTKEARCE